MSNAAVSQALSAVAKGRKVSVTVDNRSVAYAPRRFGSMLYVPVRFFTETGQKVTWDRNDMRATVREDDGRRKASVEYDARIGQRNRQPGPSMRPRYEKGTLYVPLASGLAAFGLYAEWVPSSNRLNVKTDRPGR